MALRQIQSRVRNGPPGQRGSVAHRSKLPVTGLQRQTLGNMANKQPQNQQESKKTFKPRVTKASAKPGQAKTAAVTSGLAKLTALPKPADDEVHKVAVNSIPSGTRNETKNGSTINESLQQKQPSKKSTAELTKDTKDQQAMDTAETQATRKRTRTLTPQPMDVTEMAGEVQRKLCLNDNPDQQDMDDPFSCGQYALDIYTYLHQLERDFHPDPSYMARQPKINHKMRAILVDWLVLVHTKFNFLQETLYLTVSIIDRFLEVFPTGKEQLQLVGVTAMFLAAKYEEIYYPQIDDFVYITDNSYTPEQVCQMERIILRTLNYSLSPPAAIQFLRRYSKIAKATINTHTMAKYFTESSLMDYSLLKHLPSQIAAASLALALEIVERGEWTPTLAHYSGYSSSSLDTVKRDLVQMIMRLPTSRQQAIRDKYSSPRFMRVAKSPSLHPDSGADGIGHIAHATSH